MPASSARGCRQHLAIAAADVAGVVCRAMDVAHTDHDGTAGEARSVVEG
jgi:hypothetical protein